MSHLFAWGGQSIGVSASASALPVNTQDWSPLQCYLLLYCQCCDSDFGEWSRVWLFSWACWGSGGGGGLVIKSCQTLQPHGLESARLLSVSGNSQARIIVLPFCSPGDLPNPGIEPASPAPRQIHYCWVMDGSHWGSDHIPNCGSSLPLEEVHKANHPNGKSTLEKEMKSEDMDLKSWMIMLIL